MSVLGFCDDTHILDPGVTTLLQSAPCLRQQRETDMHCRRQPAMCDARPQPPLTPACLHLFSHPENKASCKSWITILPSWTATHLWIGRHAGLRVHVPCGAIIMPLMGPGTMQLPHALWAREGVIGRLLGVVLLLLGGGRGQRASPRLPMEGVLSGDVP